MPVILLCAHLCVTWSVCLIPANTVEPIEMPFTGAVARGLNESCIRWETYWRHLANMVERSMLDGEAGYYYRYCSNMFSLLGKLAGMAIYFANVFFPLFFFIFFK